MRYDKYDGKTGGFRAKLAAAVTAPAGAGPIKTDTLLGVGLDANGRVVVGGGVSGLLGVLSVPSPKSVGDVVDVMTAGEVVEFTKSDGTAAAPGTVYFADATTGIVSTTNTGVRVGHTVELSRLVVRVVPAGVVTP